MSCKFRAKMEHKNVPVDVIFAAISPVRPYAYIYSYNGGQHKTIQGNFQFFETDQTKISGALKHLQSSGIRSNIYIVITGAMTPTQKQIVYLKKQSWIKHYFLTSWLGSKRIILGTKVLTLIALRSH